MTRETEQNGRKIDNAYADLVVAERHAQRREQARARLGSLGPASPVRRIDPAAYLAEQQRTQSPCTQPVSVTPARVAQPAKPVSPQPPRAQRQAARKRP